MLNVVSDSVIAAAYFAIPILLMELVRRPEETSRFTGFSGCLPPHSVVRHYSSAECGYGMGAALSLRRPCQTATGLASLGTAVVLFRLLPQILEFLCPRNCQP